MVKEYSKQKILIIDDDEVLCMVLKDDLEFEGYQVSTENDGAAGLTNAKSKNYDLVILDIMLPKMNGFKVCRKLRRSNIFNPILILSAKGEKADIRAGLEAGADEYITKPFSRCQLMVRIKALFGNKFKSNTN